MTYLYLSTLKFRKSFYVRKFSSEYLPNLKADIKRCNQSTADDATKVIITLYKTVKEHDGEAATESEVFLAKYDLVLEDDAPKKKYKFHDIGKENMITVKLSRSFAKPQFQRKIKNWKMP